MTKARPTCVDRRWLLRAPVVSAELVEYNPTRDPSGVTGMVFAKIFKEIAAKMLEK